MNAVDSLTRLLAELPGIGPRQARRMVFSLLRRDPAWLYRLTESIKNLQSQTSQCVYCFRHFDGISKDVCPTCTSSDKTILMIVEKETDLENVERLGIYSGRYFILGGLLPVTSRKTVVSLRINELLTEVNRSLKEDGLSEIILALPVNTEGDHTADYLRSELSKIEHCPELSTLARGLSTGSEIEYSDDKTFQSALQNRNTI